MLIYDFCLKRLVEFDNYLSYVEVEISLKFEWNFTIEEQKNFPFYFILFPEWRWPKISEF